MYEFEEPVIRVGQRYFPVPEYEYIVEQDNTSTHSLTGTGNEQVVTGNRKFTLDFVLPEDRGQELESKIAHNQVGELTTPEVTLTGLRTTEAISLQTSAFSCDIDRRTGQYEFRLSSPEVTAHEAY